MKRKTVIQWTLFSIFLLMIILGVSRGEVTIVLDKAIRICLECIGIG